MEINNLNSFLKEQKERGNASLIIFSTETCRWCQRLKEILKKDPTLELYAKTNSITIEWVKLPSKKEDEESALNEGRESFRSIFGIKSLPTIAIYNYQSELLETTEYIDEADNAFGFNIGSQAYVDWVSPILFPKKRQ
jgi:thioredoxin-related protein